MQPNVCSQVSHWLCRANAPVQRDATFAFNSIYLQISRSDTALPLDNKPLINFRFPSLAPSLILGTCISIFITGDSLNCQLRELFGRRFC